MEKEIIESTLAQVMPELSKGQITKANKKHGKKFPPKYITFNILQNNIEYVVNKSTKMWKLINGLTTIKKGEENPFERKNYEEEEENDKDEETKKEKGDNIMEVTQQGKDEVATTEE